MIVNTGRIKLFSLQKSQLQTYYWHLLGSNVSISATTVYGDMTEPTFTGYAPQLMPTLPDPTIVSTRATMVPLSYPIFTNTSGSSATVYGWWLANDDDATVVLIAAYNFGSTSIPAGQSLVLAPTLTDTDEP